MAVLAFPLLAGSYLTLTSVAGVAVSAATSASLITGGSVALGAFIDQRFVFPALFKGDPVQGPRLGDLQLSAAEEGAPMMRAMGPHCRLPGILFWASDLIESHHNSPSGGKGGTGANALAYTYSAQCAVSFLDGTIVAIDEIFADGKTFYKDHPDTSYAAFDPDFARATKTAYPNGPGTAYWYYLEYESHDPDVDLSQFVSGRTVSVSGWTSTYTTNNGTWNIESSRRDHATGWSWVKVIRLSINGFSDFAGYVGGGGQSVTLFQKQSKYSKKQLSNDPVFYKGTETQTGDPTIANFEAAGDVNAIPAFRGRSFAVFDGIQLADYGNRIPSFEAMGRVDESITVGEGIARVCGWAGMEPSEYDVSLCTDDLQGYVVQGVQKGTVVLQPLLVAFDILTQQRGEVLHFFPRSLARVIAIPSGDLAAFEFGGSAPQDIRMHDEKRAVLPREVLVKYIDPQRSYQTGQQRGRRSNTEGTSPVLVDFGSLVMDAGKARACADRLLWTAWVNAKRISVQLPPSYQGVVLESDILTFTANGENWRVLLDRVDRGANGLVLAEGVREDTRLRVQAEVAEDSAGTENATTGNQNPTFSPPAVTFHMIDIACLRDEHVQQPGLYVAAALSDPRLPFGGAVLLESTDDGVTWAEIRTLTYEATMGVVRSGLSTSVAAGMWDDASAIEVELIHGELESVTEDQCLAGFNRAVVGGEVIGYANAEVTGTTSTGELVYTLSHLLRGLQGTDDAIAGHADDERFIVLTQPGVEFIPINVAAVGQTRSYKCVPIGGVLERYDAFDFELAGATVRPLAPTNVYATRDGSNNATVVMTRRSRGVVRLLGSGAIPFHEPRLAYTVVLRDPTDTVDAASVSQSTQLDTISSVFSAATQTTAGYTPGDPLKVRFYSSSEWLGTGQVGRALV